MTKAWKDNVSFVLVEPREAGNIGASARALKNMGFRRLDLVNPACQITDEARWFAHGAEDVLDGARISLSLQAAVGNATLLVGTTRRKGKRRGLIHDMERAVSIIRERACRNRVAVLFGREDRGLFNEEVEECGFLLTIPVDADQPSLNLAQAVLLVAYELSRHPGAEQREKGPWAIPGFVDYETQAVLFARVGGLLKELGYIPRGDRDIERRAMANLKHFVGRAGVTPWELQMLHGICSRVERRMGMAESHNGRSAEMPDPKCHEHSAAEDER